MIPAMVFSVPVDGCVVGRRITVGRGLGQWRAATKRSDSFSILHGWNPRVCCKWSMFVFV